MNKLTYATGNYGKYLSVKEKFSRENLDVEFLICDFTELEVDNIEEISKRKAIDAYNILGTPVFVADSGFYIEDYPGNPGYPGVFVKRSGVSQNIDKLLEDMKGVLNRKCKFLDCLTFYDGTDFYVFYGVSEGTIATEKYTGENEKKKSNLWRVFIPNNCNKTLEEMTDEERNNRCDGHTSATEEFIKWYKTMYKGNSRELKRDI